MAGGKARRSMRHAILCPVIMVFVSVITALPLLHYALTNYDMFMMRSSRMTMPMGETEPSWSVFFGNVKDAAHMFHFPGRGDVAFVNTVPRVPALDKITGILFGLGILLILGRLGAALFRRLPKSESRSSAVDATLLVVFVTRAGDFRFVGWIVKPAN